MRQPIDLALDRVEWQAEQKPENTEGLPYPTHSGVLDIGGIKLRVYQLSTGDRIIDGTDLALLLLGMGVQ